ncbi:MAG: hypothetical protein OHK0026_09190 [Rhodocyclaceae bacterium]
MSAPKSAATVSLSELLGAFEFVSADPSFEHSALIDPDNGAIYYRSPDVGCEEEVPDDLETSDRYIEVPHKYDLNLGRDLALSFVDEAIPDEYEKVATFFRRKGAYARFKGLLEAHRLLERWYAFEARETEKALRAWCADHGIALAGEAPAA